METISDYQTARTSAALFDQSARGKIEVRGKDAPSFLHNLCTNDIVSMPLGAGCEAFFCTSRAKVVAHALIYHVRLADKQDAFWIDTAGGFNEKLMQHLNRYLIAEQVELADRTSDFTQVHLAGPNAKAILARASWPTRCPILNRCSTWSAPSAPASIRTSGEMIRLVCRDTISSV